MFSVAKAKRQLQMFSARKRSGSGNVFCTKAKRQWQMFSVAKAKRQLQMFSARKRSGSGKCFLHESEAAVAIMPRDN
ncbi:hypothetical protein [Lysinibacillus xylanilyticus]|uniref:hypothetical protein n=1 Tax=Lysinibacillus xylanilyticus TaxID=582475 RepID=UPI00380880C9